MAIIDSMAMSSLSQIIERMLREQEPLKLTASDYLKKRLNRETFNIRTPVRPVWMRSRAHGEESKNQAVADVREGVERLVNAMKTDAPACVGCPNVTVTVGERHDHVMDVTSYGILAKCRNFGKPCSNLCMTEEMAREVAGMCFRTTPPFTMPTTPLASGNTFVLCGDPVTVIDRIDGSTIVNATFDADKIADDLAGKYALKIDKDGIISGLGLGLNSDWPPLYKPEPVKPSRDIPLTASDDAW